MWRKQSQQSLFNNRNRVAFSISPKVFLSTCIQYFTKDQRYLYEWEQSQEHSETPLSEHLDSDANLQILGFHGGDNLWVTENFKTKYSTPLWTEKGNFKIVTQSMQWTLRLWMFLLIWVIIAILMYFIL